MNILITGAFNCSKEFIEEVKKLGYTVHFQQYESDELSIDPTKIDITICNGLFLHHNIEKFSNLKKILLTSAGLDRVPIDYCKENDIEVYNAKGVYSIPMAEFVVMNILMIYKQALFFYEKKVSKVWQKNRNLQELNGKNVGILGVGSVGKEIAKRIKAFETRVFGFDINVENNQYFDEVVHINCVENYLNKLDILICCLPITPSTKHLIDYKFLSQMKDTSILVNVSRGGIVNEEDLGSILNERKEMTAILDVFETEPLDEYSQLWEKENVYLYPHNSFVSTGNNNRLEKCILEHL